MRMLDNEGLRRSDLPTGLANERVGALGCRSCTCCYAAKLLTCALVVYYAELNYSGVRKDKPGSSNIADCHRSVAQVFICRLLSENAAKLGRSSLKNR